MARHRDDYERRGRRRHRRDSDFGCADFLLMLTLGFLIGIFLFGVSYIRDHLRKDRKQANMCTSDVCVKAAAELIDSLNESADRCDDFYRFVCGGFDLRDPFRNSSMTSLLDQVRTINEKEIKKQLDKYANVCKDVDKPQNDPLNLQSLANMLKSLGNWPASVPDKFWTRDASWANLALRIVREYGVPTVFDVRQDGADIFISPAGPVKANAIYVRDMAKAIWDTISGGKMEQSRGLTDDEVNGLISGFLTSGQVIESIEMSKTRDAATKTNMSGSVSEIENWYQRKILSKLTDQTYFQIDWPNFVKSIDSGTDVKTVHIIDKEFFENFLVSVGKNFSALDFGKYLYWPLINNLTVNAGLTARKAFSGKDGEDFTEWARKRALYCNDRAKMVNGSRLIKQAQQDSVPIIIREMHMNPDMLAGKSPSDESDEVRFVGKLQLNFTTNSVENELILLRYSVSLKADAEAIDDDKESEYVKAAFEQLPGKNTTTYPGLDYSRDQLFFMSYARMHCEGSQSRANGEKRGSKHVEFVTSKVDPKGHFGRVFECYWADKEDGK